MTLAEQILFALAWAGLAIVVLVLFVIGCAVIDHVVYRHRSGGDE